MYVERIIMEIHHTTILAIFTMSEFSYIDSTSLIIVYAMCFNMECIRMVVHDLIIYGIWR